MQVTINGEVQELPENLTVVQLLGRLGLTQRRVAVEINRAIVVRSLHETRTISPGDVVEIVSLVGGG